MKLPVKGKLTLPLPFISTTVKRNSIFERDSWISVALLQLLKSVMLFQNCLLNNNNHICLYYKLLSDIIGKQTHKKTTPWGKPFKERDGHCVCALRFVRKYYAHSTRNNLSLDHLSIYRKKYRSRWRHVEAARSIMHGRIALCAAKLRDHTIKGFKTMCH